MNLTFQEKSLISTDYGLPHRNPKLDKQTIWADKFWVIYGIFISFWYCESLVHVFY